MRHARLQKLPITFHGSGCRMPWYSYHGSVMVVAAGCHGSYHGSVIVVIMVVAAGCPGYECIQTTLLNDACFCAQQITTIIFSES